MSKIELRDVSKVFDRPSFGTASSVSRPGGQQADRAFAERAQAQAATEREQRRGQGSHIMALDHVNLVIPDGQTIAIVGPSGCGKSTLLRVVAGLETYTGQVLYDDEDMGIVQVKDRYIGMVFQNYALYPHFKGHGNLGFFFKVRKIDDKAAEERIRATAELMGIGFDALLERKPGTLSGGQQQRVAIARAIVRNPRLFLFDEPLSNLDAKLRMQTRIEIKRLLHRFQITSIYVTHDQLEAMALGDVIAVMKAGKIEQVGEYQWMRDDPATGFVAGFLGLPPMNLLLGGSVAEGALRIGELAVPLPDAVKAQVETGQAVTLGVRPEAIRLARTMAPPALAAGRDLRMRGSVEMVEPDFGRQLQVVYMRTGDVAYGVVTDLDAVMVGETVEVLLPLDQLYYFDSKTDRRIK
jgi:ABC-type sugar transport system ATPase subunit